jgi:hypothetical protein
MGAHQLFSVFGDPHLTQTTTDRRRRADVRRGDVTAGVAAFELLYGPRAGLAMTLRDPSDIQTTLELLEIVVAQARRLGVNTLQATISHDGHELAGLVPGAQVSQGSLSIDLAEYPSVQNT